MLIAGDVSNQKFCDQAVARTVRELGRLDVLVNNAAFQVHTSRFEDLTAKHFDETLKTNLYGYFYMAQAAVKHMKPGSAIVNTGSVTGLLGSEVPARLFDDQGRHSCVHTLAGHATRAARNPGQRRRARAGLDAAQSFRQGSEGCQQIRRRHADEAARPAGGDRAGLCLSRLAALLQLYHWRNPADHRRLQRRITWRSKNISRKRDFKKTPEPPPGRIKAHKEGLSYLIQKHDATRLHYDFRLELDGVLLSWAVTKGPSLNPADKRLAVRTEDHPLSYGTFEGTIPKGEYGGGTVMMWDEGTWEPKGDPRAGLKKGHLSFILHGERLKGGWDLIRMRGDGKRENWLLIKENDAEARKNGANGDFLNDRRFEREEPAVPWMKSPAARLPAARQDKTAMRRLRSRHPAMN